MIEKTIYTVGYGAGWTLEALDTAMREWSAVLVDTRLAPYSRKPGWSRDALRARFGGCRYSHIKALGNLNYKGGPIALADAEGGIRSLAAILGNPLFPLKGVILLCGCLDVHTCHRKVVAELAVERLSNRFALTIEHLEPPPTKRWKCLSIRQPWAWAILYGGKDIENRTWRTNYRGPILIHAAQGGTHGDYAQDCAFINRVDPSLQIPKMADLPRGGIAGAAYVEDCVDADTSPWLVGPHGFKLKDARPLPFLPMRGQLGLFDVPVPDLQPIAAELAALNLTEWC